MAFPTIRLRRNRKSSWSRDLVAENTLSAKDFIYPLFIHENDAPTPVSTMPGVMLHSMSSIIAEAKKAQGLGIPLLALFPSTPAHLKEEMGKEAINPDNLICRTIKEIKDKVPGIGIMADVALDPYTSHGHDGILTNGEVINDHTIAMLVKQAVILAKAGADMVSPSDMMDGRIAAIRDALEQEGFHHTQIAAYSAKYASNYYGPFRDAVGSSQPKGKIDKRSYQLDFRNADEALNEIAMDIKEGADLIIVKPGMPYLDIVAKARAQFNIPIVSYQVSGEYSMLKLAAQHGIIDYNNALREAFYAFKRAGCTAIISYAACEFLSIVEK